MKVLNVVVGADGFFYLPVVKSVKGALGTISDKVGFLKFELEEEAETAKDTIEAGGVSIMFADQPTINKKTGQTSYALTVGVEESVVEPAAAE